MNHPVKMSDIAESVPVSSHETATSGEPTDRLTRINIALSVLLVIAAALAIAMDVDYTQPNVEFLPEMKRSAAFDAFAANPVLPDGRTLQAPVAGTIARGDLPLYYAATKEDAARAGEELRNPFVVESNALPVAEPLPVIETPEDKPVQPKESDAPETSATIPQKESAQPPVDPQARLNASIQRGALVYGVFCVSCHGPSGAGDGPVAKRGFPPPPPLTTGKSVLMKDGQLFHILTYGQGSMSSTAAQLKRSGRWDVINYVRSLQQGAAQAAPQGQTTAPNEADVPVADPETDESAGSSDLNAELPTVADPDDGSK